MMIVNVGLNGSFAGPVSPTVSSSSFSSSVGSSSVANSPNNSPKVVAPEIKARVFKTNQEKIGVCHSHAPEQLNRQTGFCCLGCLVAFIMFAVSGDVNSSSQTPQFSKDNEQKKME